MSLQQRMTQKSLRRIRQIKILYSATILMDLTPTIKMIIRKNKQTIKEQSL